MLKMANQPSIAILGEQYPRSWFYVNHSFHRRRCCQNLLDGISLTGTLKIYSPMTFFIDAMTSAGWFMTSFASASRSSP